MDMCSLSSGSAPLQVNTRGASVLAGPVVDSTARPPPFLLEPDATIAADFSVPE